MSFFSIAFPPASKFSTKDIPDLTGKVIIVTGANAGVGKETAKALLAKNATVYMGGRNVKKLDEAVKELATATGKAGIPLILDLADLHSIKQGVESFLSKETRLDVLFNNAGVMHPPLEQVTAQGYDLQFGTNVIGHWYLTKLLLPILLSTASATGGKTRVVHTSSSAAAFNKRINFDTFKDGPTRKKKSLNNLYGQSKLGNIMIANEFARRYGDQGLISCSCDPGLLRTELQRHNAFVNWSAGIMFHPAPMGALTQLWAGTTDEGLKMNGKYLIPWARYGKMHPGADEQSGELWTWLEAQVKEMGL